MSVYHNIFTSPEKQEPITNIAVFRALYLGDMLCIIPAMRALRTAYPNAKVTLIGLPWQENFAKRFHIYFDSFIAFPGWPGLPEQGIMLEKIPSFISDMQKQQFDLVMQMQGNGAITNNMCMLWGAKKVCGLRRANDYCPDEKLFPVSEDDDHEVLRFLKLIDALGIPRQGVDIEFAFDEDEIRNFGSIKQKLNLPDTKYVCLHPGARDLNRRWSAENFAYVGSRLAAEGYTVLLTGSEEERRLLQEVKDHIQYPSISIIEMLGEVSIGDLALIIAHAALLVSNDTGVSHIAAALRVPSVIVFSAFSTPARWAPLDRMLHRTIPAAQAENPKNVVDVALTMLHQHDKKERALEPFSNANAALSNVR